MRVLLTGATGLLGGELLKLLLAEGQEVRCLLRSDRVRVKLLLALRRRSKRSVVSAASWWALRSRARDAASSLSRRSTSAFLLPAAQAFQSDFRMAGSLVMAIRYLSDGQHVPPNAIAFDRPATGLEASQGSVLTSDGEPHGEGLSPCCTGGRRRVRW